MKDGVALLEHALRGQSFGGQPKEPQDWCAWRDHLVTNALVRGLTKEEAFEFATVARAATNFWPGASQIIQIVEARERS